MTADLPKKFEPIMIGWGTANVSVGVKRAGWVPVSGETYLCLRWVLRRFKLKEPCEVTPDQWKEMDALQKHVFALRDEEKRQGVLL